MIGSCRTLKTDKWKANCEDIFQNIFWTREDDNPVRTTYPLRASSAAPFGGKTIQTFDNLEQKQKSDNGQKRSTNGPKRSKKGPAAPMSFFGVKLKEERVDLT